MLAVIDTSVWISSIIAPQGFSSGVVAALRAKQFTPVVCSLMQQELTRVLHRKRLATRYRVTPDAIAEVLNLIGQRAFVIDDPQVDPVGRDPTDDVFIAAAKTARAEFLVTRDDDLKRDPNVARYLEGSGVNVVSVSTFLARLAL